MSKADISPSVKDSNRTAGAALITGVLSFFVSPLIPLSIIVGIVGWKKAKKINCGKKKAIAGLILSILAIGMIPLYVMGFNYARNWTKEFMSGMTLSRISIAVELYKQEHKAYPDTFDRLVESGITLKDISNPKSKNQATYQNGKVINDGYAILKTGNNVLGDDILIYETEPYAYKGKVYVLTVRGSVMLVPVEELHARLAEQKARQQGK